MRRFVLLANDQKDIRFQYANFDYETDLKSIYFDYSQLRIRLLRLISMAGLRDSKLVYKVYLKRIFHKTIINHLSYNCQDEYVFIVMARVYEKYGRNLVRFLRKEYPSCIVVIYIVDLIHNMHFSLRDAKKDFNLICSFDEGESIKEDMCFVLEPFSIWRLNSNLHVEKTTVDVSFAGAAKGRYDRIFGLFSYLRKHGLKCEFYVVGVDKNQRIEAEGIHYKWLDFEKVLELTANSKCIVEIMQPGEYSATSRYAEAMLLNTNLITDCPALADKNEESILYTDWNSELDLKTITQKNTVDKGYYIDLFSNRSFVNTIEKHLQRYELLD